MSDERAEWLKQNLDVAFDILKNMAKQGAELSAQLAEARAKRIKWPEVWIPAGFLLALAFWSYWVSLAEPLDPWFIYFLTGDACQ